VFLPLTLREDCTPGTQRTDVVLVIDASSSMLEPTASGRTKLAVATDAARVFLDQLHFADGDQAAVVSFNAEATLLAPLSTNRAALDAALAGITTAQFTRIDRGIAVAAGELAGARHHAANTPVMIVLTDGRANPVPVSVAEAEARAAKDAGVVLFTIGLGNDLDTEALLGMASKPDYFYVAPGAEALAGIYRGIAVAIPCPAGAFWGRR
jgi:Mg-chelatase subunit ChlD